MENLNATMRVVLVVLLLGIVGLTSAHIPYMNRDLGASQYDSFCTDSTSAIYTVPHPTDCSLFLICKYTSATVGTCPDGKWYNEFDYACMPKNRSSCAHVPSTNVPNYVLELCSKLPLGKSMPAEACDRYYVCEGDRAYELSCRNGQHYSRAYSACMNPLMAGCRALNTMCQGQYTGFAFPSLTCNEYYICKENQLPELTSCCDGLYFSADLQQCTNPDESGCVEYPPTTEAPGCPTEPNPPCAPSCTADNTGTFFPGPKCNTYYMCFNSNAVEMECGCGQFFDQTELCCKDDTNHTCS